MTDSEPAKVDCSYFFPNLRLSQLHGLQWRSGGFQYRLHFVVLVVLLYLLRTTGLEDIKEEEETVVPWLMPILQFSLHTADVSS